MRAFVRLRPEGVEDKVGSDLPGREELSEREIDELYEEVVALASAPLPPPHDS